MGGQTEDSIVKRAALLMVAGQKEEKMVFEKKIMRMSELEKMGYPKQMLLRAYRERNQSFARKINPLISNSPIVFEVEGFSKWWGRQVTR